MFEQISTAFINGVSAGTWVFGAALVVILGLLVLAAPFAIGGRRHGKE